MGVLYVLVTKNPTKRLERWSGRSPVVLWSETDWSRFASFKFQRREHAVFVSPYDYESKGCKFDALGGPRLDLGQETNNPLSKTSTLRVGSDVKVSPTHKA